MLQLSKCTKNRPLWRKKLERLESKDRKINKDYSIDIEACFIRLGLLPNTKWL